MLGFWSLVSTGQREDAWEVQVQKCKGHVRVERVTTSPRCFGRSGLESTRDSFRFLTHAYFSPTTIRLHLSRWLAST